MSALSQCPSVSKFPCVFFNHGGGPLPLLGRQPSVADVISQYPKSLSAKPSAILVVTAHWIEDIVSISSGDRHDLLFDYGGYPPETYRYTYDAPGSPDLANKIQGLLMGADIKAKTNSNRGWDHGVFVPLKLMYPDASIPVVSMSLHSSLDPDVHLRIGEALAPLREEGVLIVGSGASCHNFEYFFARNEKVRGEGIAHSKAWDQYLIETLANPEINKEPMTAEERRARLIEWFRGPSSRACHPQGGEEHLIPLHVIAGAAGAHRNDSSIAKVLKAEGGSFSEFATSNFEWSE